MEQFAHSIKITELKKQKQIDAFSDVVVHCRWELKTTYNNDSEMFETFSGATPFFVKPEDLQNGFTDFSNLTESDLISWVELNAMNLNDLKKKNERKILERIENTYEVVNNPWNHEDIPTKLTP
jgi:hypothetical protein